MQIGKSTKHSYGLKKIKQGKYKEENKSSLVFDRLENPCYHLKKKKKINIHTWLENSISAERRKMNKAHILGQHFSSKGASLGGSCDFFLENLCSHLYLCIIYIL